MSTPFSHSSLRTLRLAVSLFLLGFAPLAFAHQPQPNGNIGHNRHTHHHNPKHPTQAPTPKRFTTSRTSHIVLPLPTEQDAFTFAVFGDRTGGPVDGVKVLADAVRDTNLLEPDLVMTVGDLINGYNDTPKWLEQMREYKDIMNQLRCPWFPVSGNHDIYWREPDGAKPPGEHESNYEMHFGPLWYAFAHKSCWFIALYSDEGDPRTGQKAINKPESQKMSDEQFNWLKSILSQARDAQHIFLFLHHPRWLGGNYGNDWDKVHKELVAAGNVTAVFAGHIHHMRYDPMDGIEYVTLATVGGHQDGVVPDAGYLHQYHVITVRKNQVALAAFPVGEAIDVRELTGNLMDECVKQTQHKPVLSGPLVFTADGSINQRVKVTIPNLTSRTIELTFAPESADSRWAFAPDHTHTMLEPGTSTTVEFQIAHPAGGADRYLRAADIVISTDVLMPGHRYALPDHHAELALDIDSLPAPDTSQLELAMQFDGDDALALDASDFTLPDGPFTIECWLRADIFGERTGLLCKTEQSDFGIFVSNGKPSFSAFVGKAYATATADKSLLTPGRWQHIAGVFDGSEVRVYADGRLAARTPGSGKRKTNSLPLMIGADVTSSGGPDSHFAGKIDAVHISMIARYTSDSFTPARRASADQHTVFLTNFDRQVGHRIWSEGPGGKRALAGRPIGAPALVPAD